MKDISDERYRLVVLGSSKVGKTSIIKQFLSKEFPERYKETIEDLHSRDFRIQGEMLHLDVLDTNFDFPDMRKVAIASAHAFMLVFAVDNVQSFKEMSDLWSEICERRDNIQSIPIVVVGNKADLPTKKIYEATATAWTSRLNADVRYVEASAKTNTNINTIFSKLLELSGFPFEKPDEEVDDQNEKPVLQKRSSRTALSKRNSGGSVKTPPPKTPPSTKTSLPSSPHNKSPPQQFSPTDKTHPPARNTLSVDNHTMEILQQQLNSSLTLLPMDMVANLRRNRSLRVKAIENNVDENGQNGTNGHAPLSRTGSLIRRTKHMSLRLRKNHDKQEIEPQDDQECRIS
uniref:Uncharacterized protein n=1 Tax=Acrobeloides nanus TaxID=290746 RepID=A0A914D3M3_9BILA